MPRLAKGPYDFYHPNKFKGFIIAQGYEPPSKYASALGMNEKTFKDKLRGVSMWNAKELVRIRQVTAKQMTDEEFLDIFLDYKHEDIIGI